jgi:hypothetical protein
MRKQALNIVATLSFLIALLAGAIPAQARVLHSPLFDDAHGWGSDPSYWKTIQFPDLNGDGRRDVCGRGSGGIHCALNLYYNFGPLTLWTQGFSDAAGWKSHPSHWSTIRFPDVNGDGKADVCGRAYNGIHCALSDGVSSFGTLTHWDRYWGFTDQNRWNTDPSYWETIQFPDIDGDGMADVCGRGFDNSGDGGIVCGNSTGQVFTFTRVRTQFFSDANQWNTKRSFWATIRFPDLNGDGRADVCGRGSAGLWCGLGGGYGQYFNQPTLWSNLYSDQNFWDSDESHWGTIQYADINGDKKADVCGRGFDGLQCGEAIVPGFGSPRFNTFGQVHVPVFSDMNGWRLDKYYKSIRLVDVNGDGRADACGRGTNGIQCALAQPWYPPLMFSAVQSWLPWLGDNLYGASESYWGTVQPADVDYRISLNGAEWCGRGPDGVKCYVR